MKTNKLSILGIMAISTIFGVQTNAANLTASSNSPVVYFHDTDSNTNIMAMKANDLGSSYFFNIYNPQNIHSILRIYSAGDSAYSIVVDSSGDISLANGSVFIDRSENRMGIGTVAPETSLHIAGDGDIRSDYNGHGWKLDNNEAWFNIGSTTTLWPFSIHEDAPAMSLQIVADGDIGLGTNHPQAKLDVRGTIENNDTISSIWSGSNTVDDGLSTLVLLSADNTAASKSSDAGFGLINKQKDFQWNFRTYGSGEGFTATKLGTGGGELVLQSPTTDFHDAKMIVGGVTVFENGHLVTASSRELKTDIKPLDTQAALDAFRKLQPVSYEYKTQKGEKVVGFIAEDVPELVAMPSRKSFDSAEVVAVLTSVLAETRAEMKAMRAEIAALKSPKNR